MKTPTISVIVPTKNSARTLEACLQSVKAQTYKHVELVVVDNFSTDTTPEIAQKYADKFFTKGPERSQQRNFAVEQASGNCVAIIDSDMKLSPEVLEQAVAAMGEEGVVGVLIPEESFGEGFWAQCKKLERSFYIGVSWMQAARVFTREHYLALGGYNADLVSGEDWDLSQRAAASGKLQEIDALIYHDEGRLSLGRTLSKKFYYATKFTAYTDSAKTQGEQSVQQQTGIIGRYMLFFKKPAKLFANPVLGIGMLVMKTLEFGWGGVGLIVGKLQQKKHA